MSIFNIFRRPKQTTAVVAKERLQIVLAHERADAHSPEYLPRLKNEILQVIGRYVAIDDDKLAIRLETAGSTSILEVNIELPSRAALAMPVQGAAVAGPAANDATAAVGDSQDSAAPLPSSPADQDGDAGAATGGSTFSAEAGDQDIQERNRASAPSPSCEAVPG